MLIYWHIFVHFMLVWLDFFLNYTYNIINKHIEMLMLILFGPAPNPISITPCRKEPFYEE